MGHEERKTSPRPTRSDVDLTPPVSPILKRFKALVLNFRTALRSVTRMYSAHSRIDSGIDNPNPNPNPNPKIFFLILLILLRLIHKNCGNNVG